MRSKASCSLPRVSGPFGDAGFATEGVEDAVGGVDAVEIFGDFAAEEALGDGLGGIAFDFDGAALLVDRDQDCAGVGAVVGADGVDDAERGMGPRTWGHCKLDCGVVKRMWMTRIDGSGLVLCSRGCAGAGD